MKNRLLVILFFFCSGSFFLPAELAAQKNNPNAEKYASVITAEVLSKHLHVLCSDEFEGRETGKHGEKLAAAYIKKNFIQLGIPPYKDTAYFQPYTITEQKPYGVTIINNGQTNTFLNDFYYFPGFADQKLHTDQLLFLGYGIDDSLYSDYKNVDVKGKILLILSGEPTDKKGKYLVNPSSADATLWTSYRRRKVETAREKGAAGLLIVDFNFANNLIKYGHSINSSTIHLESEKNNPNLGLPTFYLNENLANAILEKASEKKIDKLIDNISKTGKSLNFNIPVSMDFNISREQKTNTAENVLAYIEGSDKKDELVIITAHFDHLGKSGGKIYYGADDDGSGTAALLNLAEAFSKAKKEGNGPRRSVLIMPVSGEEKGLLGSEYYSEHPVFPLSNTVADLNIDMIGRIDSFHTGNPDYVYLIGADKISKELHELSEQANKTYCNLQLDYKYNGEKDPNRFYYRSDHYNFAKNGIPVIFYFNGVHADYHQPSDTVDKIDFKKMEKITRLVFYTAWELLNREERIKVDNPKK